MQQRILNILVAFDQMIFSIITLGKATPDETISAAAYRLEQQHKLQGKFLRPLIDRLFFFDNQHCKSSFESEVNGKQLDAVYTKLRNERYNNGC